MINKYFEFILFHNKALYRAISGCEVVGYNEKEENPYKFDMLTVPHVSDHVPVHPSIQTKFNEAYVQSGVCTQFWT